jgi:hypothetical protein
MAHRGPATEDGSRKVVCDGTVYGKEYGNEINHIRHTFVPSLIRFGDLKIIFEIAF